MRNMHEKRQEQRQRIELDIELKGGNGEGENGGYMAHITKFRTTKYIEGDISTYVKKNRNMHSKCSLCKFIFFFIRCIHIEFLMCGFFGYTSTVPKRQIGSSFVRRCSFMCSKNFGFTSFTPTNWVWLRIDAASVSPSLCVLHHDSTIFGFATSRNF